MLSFRRFFAAAAVVLTVAAGALSAVHGTARAADQFSDAQKGEIEKIVRDYLVKNPEVIGEAIMALRERQQQEEDQRAKSAISEHSEDLYHNSDDAVLGNPEGDVTLVEFFDYRCGYCKAVYPHLMDVVKADGKVRLVMKELPILGPDSVMAARWSVAAHRLGHYTPFHQRLMEHKGTITLDVLQKVARDAGIDPDTLSTEADSDAVSKILKASLDLAHTLGVNGTPAFVIGDTLIPGAIGPDQLAALIAQQRAR